MKRYILSFILLFTIQLTQAQDYTIVKTDGTVENPLSNECQVTFLKLKAEYRKMLESESSKEYIKLTEEFNRKSNKDEDIDYPGVEDSYDNSLIWIGKNLEKTEFKNIEEAQELVEKIKKINEQNVMENFELFKSIRQAVKDCGNEFSKRFYNELFIEYGPDFILL